MDKYIIINNSQFNFHDDFKSAFSKYGKSQRCILKNLKKKLEINIPDSIYNYGLYLLTRKFKKINTIKAGIDELEKCSKDHNHILSKFVLGYHKYLTIYNPQSTNKFADLDYINNKYHEIVKNINIIYKKIKEICPNSNIKYIPLYYFDEINPEVIININNKLEEEFKQNFLKDFWKDILPNHYDKIYFEDKVHLNKDSYDKFYDKINTFI